jgi:hypothetical protein
VLAEAAQLGEKEGWKIGGVEEAAESIDLAGTGRLGKVSVIALSPCGLIA